MTRFRVLVGLNYSGADGKDVRREPKSIADDIPAESVDWLLEQGVIAPIKKGKG